MKTPVFMQLRSRRNNGRPLVSFSVAATAGLILMTGCGGGRTGDGVVAGSAAEAPFITQNPESQTVPLASTASLTVTAVGAGVLLYQWSENGFPIAGATSPSYSTGVLSLADSGDRFSVTVTNSVGTATSTTAVLTIGPRSPDARDLRFKHVGFPAALTSGLSTNIAGGLNANTSAYQTSGGVTAGSPLQVGNQNCGVSLSAVNCAWFFLVKGVPTSIGGFNSAYSATSLGTLSVDLARTPKNVVATSLDEQPLAQLYSISQEQDPTATQSFTLQRVTVTDSNLQATVQQFASQGVVVTAASANPTSGIDLLAFAWAGAPGAVYDGQAVLTTYANAGSQAKALAASGYIVTSAGTADFNQVVLVGTRVHGDSLPRLLSVNGSDAGAGLVRVGLLFGNDAGNNPNLPAVTVELEER